MTVHGDEAHDGDEGEQQGVLDEGGATVVVARREARAEPGSELDAVRRPSEPPRGTWGLPGGSADACAPLEAWRLSRTAHSGRVSADSRRGRRRTPWHASGPWTSPPSPPTSPTGSSRSPSTARTVSTPSPSRCSGSCARSSTRSTRTPTIRVVVVTGRGRGFCAGADLGGGRRLLRRRRRQPRHGRSGAGRHRDEGGLLTLRIFECTKPVIAAINGPAVGVGATMTLPMDIRLASETRPVRVRVRPARPGPRGVLVVVPAPGRRDQHRARVDDHRPRVRRAGGARPRARPIRPRPRRPAARRLRAGRRDRLHHLRRVGGHDPPDALADARRVPPDGRPPRRLTGHRVARPVGGRPRRRDVVPREAPARSSPTRSPPTSRRCGPGGRTELDVARADPRVAAASRRGADRA